MGFCKIDSDFWTFFLFKNFSYSRFFFTRRIAFCMLCMIGWFVFDIWPRKSTFHDLTSKKLALKISKLVRDKLKIFAGGENLPLQLSAKIWIFMIACCIKTDWFKLVNSIEKGLCKPFNEEKIFIYIFLYWTSEIYYYEEYRTSQRFILLKTIIYLKKRFIRA